jgi:hypothetical protein
MSLALLGSTGTGLVWGWCLEFWNTGEGRSRRWRNAAASFLASILLAALHLAFAGPWGLACYAVSAVISITTHTAWRVHLRRRASV